MFSRWPLQDKALFEWVMSPKMLLIKSHVVHMDLFQNLNNIVE